MVKRSVTREYVDFVWGKQREYLGDDKPVNQIQPLVSIFVTTYQHRDFIAECLDSLLMQQTSFPYEIVVGEDESTDGTVEICKQYAEKHPEKIRLYLRDRDETVIYDDNGNFVRSINSWLLYKSLRGKYIAMCEGDDYWTDPHKLQKQVDFLEKNQDYSLCFHNVKIWKQKEGIMVDDNIAREVADTTTIVDLAEGNYIQTPSVLFRHNKQAIDTFIGMKDLFAGDYVLHMLNAKYGKIKKIPYTMAVYRVHSGGIWSEKSFEDKALKWVKMIEQIKPLFVEQKVTALLSQQQENLLTTALTNVIKDKNKMLASNIFHLYIEYGLSSDKLFEQFYNSHLQSHNLINSKAYRLGSFLLKPLLFIRKFVRK